MKTMLLVRFKMTGFDRWLALYRRIEPNITGYYLVWINNTDEIPDKFENSQKMRLIYMCDNNDETFAYLNGYMAGLDECV